MDYLGTTLTVILSLAAISTALVIPRRTNRGPRCGNCSYPLATPAQCPECGSQASSTGVLTTSLAVKLRGGVLLWLAVLCLSLIIGRSLGQFLDHKLRSLGYSHVVDKVTLAPIGGAELGAAGYVIELFTDAVTRADGRSWGHITAVVRHADLRAAPSLDSATIADCVIDVSRQRMTCTTASGGALLGESEVAAQPLPAFLVAANPAVGSGQSDVTARCLLEEIKRAIRGQGPRLDANAPQTLVTAGEL